MLELRPVSHIALTLGAVARCWLSRLSCVYRRLGCLRLRWLRSSSSVRGSKPGEHGTSSVGDAVGLISNRD